MRRAAMNNDLPESLKQIWEEENDNRHFLLKEKYEQFNTPSTIANYMASFFNESYDSSIRILDPGTGLGSLTSALVLTILRWKNKPKSIYVKLYEIDITVKQRLETVMQEIYLICGQNEVEFIWETIFCDFIKDSVSKLKENDNELYDFIILNPPYKKLGTDTKENKLLLDIGINSANYYSAFVSLSKRFLKSKGELVAITPRSFCNGVYFTHFRADLKKDIRFLNIHLFDSRTSPFKKDEVLQETIIYHCIKDSWDDNKTVNIIHSTDDSFSDITTNTLKLKKIIYPKDDLSIIRIIKNEQDKLTANRIESLPCNLSDLGIEVSTGPIVDFRENPNLLSKEVPLGAIPLLCSQHIRGGIIRWPSDEAKYNSIIPNTKNIKLLRPCENYLLIRRMSSKEEKRRIVSGVVKGELFDTVYLGFDNKTNYFHFNKKGIPLKLAKGLCLYLSSSLVDVYFRTFSGHTQVNATDLRSLKYPAKDVLENLGSQYDDNLPNQQEIDTLLERFIN